MYKNLKILFVVTMSILWYNNAIFVKFQQYLHFFVNYPYILVSTYYFYPLKCNCKQPLK